MTMMMMQVFVVFVFILLLKMMSLCDAGDANALYIIIWCSGQACSLPVGFLGLTQG